MHNKGSDFKGALCSFGVENSEEDDLHRLIVYASTK